MNFLAYYNAHNRNDELLFARIKAIGVSDSTARDYLKTIKKQVNR